jgi:hypothetical protein
MGISPRAVRINQKKQRKRMTYDTLVTASNDPAWKRRVRTSILAAAIAIADDAPSGTLNRDRDKLARMVLANPEEWTDRFNLPVALGFVAGVDLAEGTVSDANIDTRVASVWNDLIPRS